MAKVWGSAGTATVKLTIDKNDGEFIPKNLLKGCLVKKDANLRSFIEPALKPTDDKNKLENSKYVFYADIGDLNGDAGNVTKATLAYKWNKRTKKPKKTCELKDPLVVVAQKHLFLCCDSKNRNKRKFLEKYSKVLRSNQSLGSSHMVKVYGLGCIENKLQFHPFKMTQCQLTRPGQSNTATYKVDINDYRKLVDAGPLLLSDEKTLVGSFRKIGDQKITITIFGKQEIIPYHTNDASFPKVHSSIVIPNENGLERDHFSDDTVNANGLEKADHVLEDTVIANGLEREEGTVIANGLEREEDTVIANGLEREDDTVIANGLERKGDTVNLYERELNELCGLQCNHHTCLGYPGHCSCNSPFCPRFPFLCSDCYGLKSLHNFLCCLRAPPRIVAECKSNLSPSPTLELLNTPKVSNLPFGELHKAVRNTSSFDGIEELEYNFPDYKVLPIKDVMKGRPKFFERFARAHDDLGALKLDALGLELGMTPDEMKPIKEGCNPSKVLLEDYVYQTMPEEQLTVGHFRGLIKEMKRPDILKLLNRFRITYLDEARSIKDVIPCDSEIMWELCLLLNKEDNGLNGWRSLASLWGIKPEVYSKFKPSKKRNPFEILFLDWLIVERPDFSVRKLCNIFGESQMNDAKEFLERKVRERTKSTQH